MKTIKRFKQMITGQFGKSIITLMSGTTISQIIPIIFSPVLTRIFSPTDFGLYSLFMAPVSIISVIACGKYELAIVIQKREKYAADVVAVSLIIAFIVYFIAFIVILICKKMFSQMSNSPAIEGWLILIPLVGLLYTVYACANEWFVRNKEFKEFSSTKLINSISISVSSAVLGFMYGIKGGLILGQLIGYGITVFFSIYLILRRDLYLFKQVSIRKIKYFLKRYVNFPKFFLPAQLFNAIGTQLPVIFISAYFGSTVVGLMSLTQSMLAVPICTISQAFSAAFRQRASIEYAQNGNCIVFYKKTVKILFIISVVPFFSLAIFAPILFSIAFGEHWRVAGDYTRIMFPMFLMNFISEPLTSMFAIGEKYKAVLLWQGLYLIVTLITMIVGCFVFKNIIITLFLYSGGRTFVYFVNYMITHNIAKGNLARDN